MPPITKGNAKEHLAGAIATFMKVTGESVGVIFSWRVSYQFWEAKHTGSMLLKQNHKFGEAQHLNALHSETQPLLEIRMINDGSDEARSTHT